MNYKTNLLTMKETKSNLLFSFMKKVLLGLIGLAIFVISCTVVFYNLNLRAVSSSSSEVEFEVDGGYYNTIPKLKKAGLIRNELCFKIYVKMHNLNEIQKGKYILNKNMSVKDIVEVFSKGNTYNPDVITITFNEGRHMRYIAKTISENTNNTENDVFDLLKNTEYLNEIINDYWFIDNSILNNEIYYSLEGYLYPETYEFRSKDVTVKEIFKTMLDQMDKKLEPYKSDIQNNKYTVHQILTLASIVEVEGKNVDDRKEIAGVFFNRLNAGMSLGSDVTTYYAAKVDMGERDLYKAELDSVNAYNTRSASMAGKLPVGPICNPRIESIVAVLKPYVNDYYYFVADKNGKVYFTKTYSEHSSKVNELKQAGLWYMY